ncbi:MAG TPA: divergent PAP2 family protein [Candidatus Intestinimonas stercoravium]|uniref:divergent PAP2 family protein n=1 Tax=uncultured Intestinimonas sp. TaxID=1689265 RepID=UPI001F8A388F|nr:divergent PAP2 family protein [uncultured Intestinimonas sp.]HJA63368.1 divergent PAP2 family protein [Candidatus Intestinimonas stercoravium]
MNNLPNYYMGNLILVLSILAWAAAQVLKVLIGLLVERQLNWKAGISSGGMPSSHSAFVCACATSTGILYGFSSALFAIAAVVAIVVMYDAANVRRQVGRQAKILNDVIEDLKIEHPDLLKKKLTEQVGHTPLQVLAGAALGVAIGCVGTYLRI